MQWQLLIGGVGRSTWLEQFPPACAFGKGTRAAPMKGERS